MAEQISRVSLAELMGDDLLAEAPHNVSNIMVQEGLPVEKPLTGNMFDDVLVKAVDALNGVSHSENYANELVDKYVRGEVDMQDVMLAQSKMSVMMQLAVTTINAAVTTFKEITQMQV